MLAPLIDEKLKKRYYEAGYWGHETLLDVWNQQAAKYAERCYVSDDRGHRLTYGQVNEQAERLGAWLQHQGVAEGDVVSFQVPVWAEFAVVYVACLKIGAVMHPVSCTFNTPALVQSLRQVSAAAFICPSVTSRRIYEVQALELDGQVDSLKTILIMQCGTPTHTDFPTYESVLEAPAMQLEPLTRTTADSVALLLSTSGTTGVPKAVMLTHNNLLYSERVFTKELEVTEDDVMFMPAPLNHATGFNHGLISPMITGGRVVLQQKFSAENAIDFMNEEGVTWSMGATPFIYDILNCITATGKRPRTLKFYLCGGAPVPGDMVHRARQEGIVLCEVYGSTESCPHVYVPRTYALGWNGRFSGRPFKGIEVRVVDKEGNDVAPGVQGEEISRGPHLFCGYLDNPRATQAAIDEDGWFYSGDLCFMDERGRIRINGRKKEIIIRGGENLSAVEIDNNVSGCPGIADHATVGMPDERLGERVCLFAVPSGEELPTLAQVTAWLDGKGVRKHLWPERIERIDAIPRTESGKVKRNQLADQIKRTLEQEAHGQR